MDPSYSSSLGNLNPGGANPNGGFPQPSQPLSSGQGDIVLTPSQPKKLNKPIVIGVIIFAILAIIGIVAIFMMRGNIFTSHNKESLIESTDKLANYTIKGEDTTEAPVFPEDYNEYYFINQLQTDNRQSTIENTKKLADELYAIYDGYSDKSALTEKVVFLNNLMRTEKNLIEFISDLYSVDRITLDDILNGYKSGRIDNLQTYVNNYYSFTDVDNNEYSSGFHDNMEAWADYLWQIIQEYDKAGCIIDNNFSYECIKEKNDESLSQKINELNEQLWPTILNTDYYYNLSSNFISIIQTIYSVINGGDNYNYMEEAGLES